MGTPASYALLLLLAGCGPAEALTQGAFELTEGEDPDVWVLRPRPVKVSVEKEFADGTLESIATLEPPAHRITIPWGTSGSFRVTATDAEGTLRVATQSVVVEPAEMAERVLPLFAGRSDTFGRPPGAQSLSGLPSVAARFGQRYLLWAESDAAERQVVLRGYDFLLWQANHEVARLTCPATPCRFESLAVVGYHLFGIGTSWAVWLDLDSGLSGDVAVPSGLEGFEDVAGGRAVLDDRGGVFIVGATRNASPTGVVLYADAEGVLSVRRLAHARSRAAALWVPGLGLLVYGGDAEAPAAELLGPEDTTATVLGYGPDPVEGAALVLAGSDRVVRAGGVDAQGNDAPSVELDVDCLADCPSTELDFAAHIEQALGFGDLRKRAVFVGVGAAGTPEAVAVTEGLAVSVPFREIRGPALAVQAPTGHLAVLGNGLELLLP